MTRCPSPASQTTAGEALERLRACLARAGVPTPEVDAEWLACHVTGWSRADLLTRGAQPLDPDAVERLNELGARRAAREPLQLILGSVGFRYLDLTVRPGVFVPRPETETLAGEAIARTPPGGVVVETCTGTGAVACSVAAEAEPAVVLATDASSAAVSLARENAARYGLEVDVRRGDLLAPVDEQLRGRLHVLVANPPYVASHELASTEPEVQEWEPSEALVAGPTGHEVTDRLIDAAPGWLAPRGWLLLEVDERRAEDVRGRCVAGGLTDAMVVRDPAGRNRVVVAQLAAGSFSESGT